MFLLTEHLVVGILQFSGMVMPCNSVDRYQHFGWTCYLPSAG